MDANLNRRDLFKALTAAFTVLQLPAAEPGAPLFFNKDQFALLDALTELMIPADEHSPGAHEAGVAPYIDRSVAEAFLSKDKTSWQKGLASIDELSRKMHHSRFVDAAKERQIALLTKLAAAEHDPKTEPEKFFTQLKETTAFAYYSSSIGIHKDIEYKGNVILDKFVGYDAS